MLLNVKPNTLHEHKIERQIQDVIILFHFKFGFVANVLGAWFSSEEVKSRIDIVESHFILFITLGIALYKFFCHFAKGELEHDGLILDNFSLFSCSR